MREPNIDQIIDNNGNLYLSRIVKPRDIELTLKRLIYNDDDTVSTIEKLTLTTQEADCIVNVLLNEGFGAEDDIVDIVTSNRPVLCHKLKEEFKSDAKFLPEEEDARVNLFSIINK